MAELKSFLFTDICGSVSLKDEMTGRSVTERDMAFINEILTPHRERIEERLAEFGGRVVSTAGDGHFLAFPNTIVAAQWAVEVQRSHRDRPIATPSGGRVEVRISMHVGVPQVDPADPDNFVGKTVDYAARLNDYATADQILVSRSVMAILDDIGLDGVVFHSHGRHHLKGIGRVEVYELLFDGQSAQKLRERPKSHSNREWTVVPTVGFEGGGSGSASGAGGASATAVPALQRVGNYQLEELLGSGGMGDVYKGRHTQFDRVRAIKVIKPQLVAAGNQDVVRRFYQEIKAIGALEHQNIVVAIDSSAPTDRVHYLVMEHIEGVALDDLLDQRGTLSAADACEIVRQAARGLQFIHTSGMVHRDLKPSNLMLTAVDAEAVAGSSTTHAESGGQYGLVKILDLGLALLAGDRQDRLTLYDNKAMGTGMYMSPEQWRTTSVDIRADIYSLGCTLYHLLAGSPPFADSDLRPEKAHEKSRVPPLPSSAGVPRRLWDVVRKMLAKKPEDRYATPAEAAAALAPFTEGHDVVALVREYVDPDGETALHARTRPDTQTGVDTWLSKASVMGPSRRWLLGRALPVIVVLGIMVGVGWSMYSSYRQRLAEKANETLTGFAKLAAEDLMATAIDERFRVLQKDSKEEEFISAFTAVEGIPSYDKPAELVQRWLLQKYSDYADFKPSSLFVTDANGTQLGRNPKKETIGQSFATRDYFHGGGRELTPQESKGVEPIREPNLSSVYASKQTKELKVALSVPIRLPGERKVSGVLAMSLEIGSFSSIHPKKLGGNQAVLVDLRESFLEGGEPQRGLILHHSERKIAERGIGSKRVDAKVLQAMRGQRSGFVSGYQDPYDDSGARYWGAYYDVPGTWHEGIGGSEPAGWVVLVQEPMP
ncbi:MAG: protein kinase [Planctomycetota bacterium]